MDGTVPSARLKVRDHDLVGLRPLGCEAGDISANCDRLVGKSFLKDVGLITFRVTHDKIDLRCRKVLHPLPQARDVVKGESARIILPENPPRSDGEGRVHIHEIARLGMFQDLLEITTHQPRRSQMFPAVLQSVCRRNGPAAGAAERHIKFTFQVCAVDAVEAEPIEVDKAGCALWRVQLRRTYRAQALIVFSAGGREFAQFLGDGIEAVFYLQVGRDEFRVQIAEDGLSGFECKEKARGTSKGLKVAFVRWLPISLQHRNKAPLASCPSEEGYRSAIWHQCDSSISH